MAEDRKVNPNPEGHTGWSLEDTVDLFIFAYRASARNRRYEDEFMARHMAAVADMLDGAAEKDEAVIQKHKEEMEAVLPQREYEMAFVMQNLAGIMSMLESEGRHDLVEQMSARIGEVFLEVQGDAPGFDMPAMGGDGGFA